MYKYFKILVAILLFAFTATAQTASSTTVLTATNISALQSYKGGLTVVHITDTMRGGWFRLTPKGSTVIDSGVNLYSANPAYVWKRDISQSRSFNIRWFGGIGGGLATFKQDSAAITDAVHYLNTIPGNKSLYFPGTKDFYGMRGEGLVLCDNMEIYGDGDASEIRNVDPQAGVIQRGVIFYTATYDPSNNNGIYKAPQFPFYPQVAGTNWVKLLNPNDSLTLYPGKVVVVTARKRYKSALKQLWRASEVVTEEIWKRSADTIFFKHNLQENYTIGGLSSGSGGIDSTYPRILDVNSGLTTRGPLGVDRVTKNVYIHDLYLSQADYNMVDNIPYDQTKIPVNVIGYGATYESKFERLTLKSFGTFGGNLFNYCTISNMKIVSTKKVFDFGFGSTNNFVHDIDWVFYPSNYNDTTGERSFVYFDDDFHHNNFYNINVTGAQEKLDFFKIGRGAHDNKIYNWNFNVPGYNDTSTSPIGVNAVFNWGDDTGYVTHDNFVSDITIQLDTIGQWIEYEGISTNRRDLNNVIQNITFRGKIRNSAGHPAVNLDYAGNLLMKNMYFEDGSIFRLRGCDSIKMIGLYAPTFDQKTLGTFPVKANFNNVFNSSDFGAPNYLTPSVIAPINQKQGAFYYDSTLHKFYGYDGTSWTQLGGIKDYVEQTLAVGADSSWDGTPPSGTRTATYGWSKVGNITTLWMCIKYATGGTSNTTINIIPPVDVPLPLEGSVYNTLNDNMRTDIARVSTTASFSSAATSNVFWVKNGTGLYRLKVATSSVNAKCLWLRITYPSQ